MGSFTHSIFSALGKRLPEVDAPPSTADTMLELADVRKLNARAVADRDALIAKLPRGVADGWVAQRNQLLRDANDPARAGNSRAIRKQIDALDRDLIAKLEQHVDRNIMDKPDSHPFIAVMKYADDGMIRMWNERAAQYRSEAGFVDGWKTTAKMYAAMGVTLLETQSAKATHERTRPYQAEAGIQQLGHLSLDTSYPSGHTANAYAAAAVLADGWQKLAAKRAAANDSAAANHSLQQARSVERDALSIGLSRMSAGMHHASDVQLGTLMGLNGATRITGTPFRSTEHTRTTR